MQMIRKTILASSILGVGLLIVHVGIKPKLK